MIDTSYVRVPRSVLGTKEYASLVYYYALAGPDNKPYYVGSAKNPASRYLTHLTGQCRDSKAITLPLVTKGTPPTMTLFDVALPRSNRDRWAVEGHYMAKLSGLGYQLSNTERYEAGASRVRECPKCYRTLKLGTLS